MAQSGYPIFKILNLDTGKFFFSLRVPRGIAKNLSFRVDIHQTFQTREERVAAMRILRPPSPETIAKRKAGLLKGSRIAHERHKDKYSQWAQKGGKERYRRHGLGRMAEFAPYARYGTKHTEEAKAKISAGNKGKGRYHKRDKGKSS